MKGRAKAGENKPAGISRVEEVPLSLLHIPESFKQKLRAAAGVGLATNSWTKNTVIITINNIKNTELMQNFHCSMERLGYKYVTLSLDEEFYQFAQSRGIPVMYDRRFMDSLGKTLFDPLADDQSASPNFAKNKDAIFAARPAIAAIAMGLGLDPLLCDNDAAWLRDWLGELQAQAATSDFMAATGYAAVDGLFRGTADPSE
jgi:hypothetical protein